MEESRRFPDPKPYAPSPPRIDGPSRPTTTSQRLDPPRRRIDQAWRCRPLHPSQGLPSLDAFVSGRYGSLGLASSCYANGWTSRGCLARHHPKEFWCHPLCEPVGLLAELSLIPDRRSRPRWTGKELARTGLLRPLRCSGTRHPIQGRAPDRDGAFPGHDLPPRFRRIPTRR